MDTDAGTLIPSHNRNSLVAWFNLYMESRRATRNPTRSRRSSPT